DQSRHMWIIELNRQLREQIRQDVELHPRLEPGITDHLTSIWPCETAQPLLDGHNLPSDPIRVIRAQPNDVRQDDAALCFVQAEEWSQSWIFIQLRNIRIARMWEIEEPYELITPELRDALEKPLAPCFEHRLALGLRSHR